MADAPTVRHQQAVGAFYQCLTHHARQCGLGEVLLSPLDVVLDYARGLVLQPDLVYVSTARRHILSERVMGLPDMALEVLSPNPRIGALQERIDWFAAYGVREIWLFHQGAERLDILAAADGRVTASRSFDVLSAIESDVFPSLDVTVGAILRRDPGASGGVRR